MSAIPGRRPAVWPQIGAIVTAQLRTTRNHLPRTNAGTVLAWLLGVLWYAMFAGMATALAVGLPDVPISQVREWLPLGLQGVFLFWQLVPLITLSSGWSLQLKKLQIFPISNNTLFGIEAVLRLTSAPEMLMILFGCIIGLARHPDANAWSAWLLLFYIPFNLMLSLGIRDWLMNSFSRNPLREVVAIVFITASILPQILLRNGRGDKVFSFLQAWANGVATPWHAITMLSLNSFKAVDVFVTFGWIAAAAVFARAQFFKTLRQEENLRAPQKRSARGSKLAGVMNAVIGRVFSDPAATLVQKDVNSLMRMPRFRVIFGLGTLLGLMFCLTALSPNMHDPSSFLQRNFLSLILVYGLLLSGEVLIWNVFGFDGQAAQFYFVAPLSFATVLKTKNITACIFLGFQAVLTSALAIALRVTADAAAMANALLAFCTVAIFFLTVGNLSSVTNPKAIDPKQTFRKQGGLKMQMWVLLCMLGNAVLIGFALLAQWATQSGWAYVGVLGLELGIGVICYRIAMESAVARGEQRREEIADALSKSISPVGT